MTAPLDTSVPRKHLPRWNKEAQSFWIDSLSDYSQLLMGLHMPPDEPWVDDDDDSDTLISKKEEKIKAFTEEEAGIFESDIELAARLADRAVQEMQYRFFGIQQIPQQERRAKRKRPAQRKR